MQRKGTIVSYTSDELRAMHDAGLSQTDWDKVNAMTDEELEAIIAADPDEAGMIVDWDSAMIGVPELPYTKSVLNMRIDTDMLEFFKADGKGYQTRIHAVLRAYVEAHKPQKKSA